MGRNFCLAQTPAVSRQLGELFVELWIFRNLPLCLMYQHINLALSEFRLCIGYGGELISGETDRDHIHLLVSLPPSKNLTDIIRSLKTQLSKEVHSNPEYDRVVKKYIFGNAPLWSPSYFVATTGSVSMETVKNYIEGQRTDEHKRKYEKRSKYWNS